MWPKLLKVSTYTSLFFKINVIKNISYNNAVSVRDGIGSNILPFVHIRNTKSCIRCYSTDSTVKSDEFSEEEEWGKVDKEYKLYFVKEEYEVLKKRGSKGIPNVLTTENLEELAARATYSRRRRRLLTLAEMEQRVIKRKLREDNKITKEERHLVNTLEIESCSHINYRLFLNTLAKRITKPTKYKFYNYRQAYSVMYGESIILDLDFDECMTDEERKTTAVEIVKLYRINRYSRNPFNISVSNVQDCLTFNALKKILHNIGGTNCFLNVNQSSYLNLYPKEKLVYLTPSSENVLEEYDPEAVYIIGGVVNKVSKQPNQSLSKAEKEGIKTASLPTRDILWKDGKVVLKMVDVFKILLYMNNQGPLGDWKKAFKSIKKLHYRREE